jgi:uncharacterized protein
VTVTAVGTYRPVWEDGGRRVAGPDEDVVTMAVAAGRAALRDDPVAVPRVVLVTREPDVTEGVPTAVLALALGLPAHTPVELRLGGAPATVDALLAAAPGTLVIGVDAGAVAAAALTGDGGAELAPAGRVGGSLPMRVRHVGRPAAAEYADPRVERERGWVPVVAALKGPGDTFLAGVRPGDAKRLGGRPLSTVDVTGAAAPVLALAAGLDGRLVGIETASGVAADVTGADRIAVHEEVAPPLPVDRQPKRPAADLDVPFSLPAYDRAVVAKVGMVAARCACGEYSFPPRRLCLSCGRTGATEPVELPRTGAVYTAVTVYVPVPGVAGPHTLAIVALDGVPVRVLAQVADTTPAATRIGDRGRLVLRRVAVREGVPDYGYAFLVDPRAEEVAA